MRAQHHQQRVLGEVEALDPVAGWDVKRDGPIVEDEALFPARPAHLNRAATGDTAEQFVAVEMRVAPSHFTRRDAANDEIPVYLKRQLRRFRGDQRSARLDELGEAQEGWWEPRHGLLMNHRPIKHQVAPLQSRFVDSEGVRSCRTLPHSGRLKGSGRPSGQC
jgi:hypothetical protein